MLQIEVVLAWPGQYVSRQLQLPLGASVSDAVQAAGWDNLPEIAAYAIYGVMAKPQTALHTGDRVELLRALQIDPKQARRRRAKA